jgi:hypothetical protein
MCGASTERRSALSGTLSSYSTETLASAPRTFSPRSKTITVSLTEGG